MSDVYIDGPVACREFVLAHTCQENAGHKHAYDHVTVVNAGAVLVYVRGHAADPWTFRDRYERGEFFTVNAGVEHRIKADADGTVYTCIFCHRGFGSDETVSQYNGNLAAYE